MENNIHNFSGQVQNAKERRIAGQAWGSISAKVVLGRNGFDFNGSTIRLNTPTIWINLKTEYEGNKLKKSHQYALDQCLAQKYVFFSAAKIKDYEFKPKDDMGKVIDGAPTETRYNIEISCGGCSFSEKPFKDINVSMLKGQVESITENGQLVLSMAYMMKSEMKFHKALVMYQGDYNPSLIGKTVIVFGQVFGKTPNGIDKIYVVADVMEVLRA